MSPLCGISAKYGANPTKWAKEVKGLYGEDIPPYVASLQSPMREFYDTEERREGEILQSLTKVLKMSTEVV